MLHKFGHTEGYQTRVFVAFTGKHYDALALSTSMGGLGAEADDRVLFIIGYYSSRGGG